MIGRIHSLQTFGTVDGPGIRYVAFLQGCRLHCQYCHNRDLWDEEGGKSISTDELIEDILKYKSFYDSSCGGVTVSGGEPLLQMDFVTELFTKCKERGLHTAVDTAAAIVNCDEAFDRLIEVTDLFLLDIKEIDEERHKELTGASNKKVIAVAKYLSEKKKPVWIRHVVVPGLTMNETTATDVAQFLSTLDNIEKVELLPYHRMGAYKWKELGEKYSLEDTPLPTAEDLQPIKAIFARHNLPYRCSL